MSWLSSQPLGFVGVLSTTPGEILFLVAFVCVCVCILQLATISQFSHQFICNVNLNYSRSNVVVQFSLRSSYGWSHMLTSSSQHHILLLLLNFKKRHCRCNNRLKIAQRILTNFTNFNNMLKFTILTNFKTESHEFSNYCQGNESNTRFVRDRIVVLVSYYIFIFIHRKR